MKSPLAFADDLLNEIKQVQKAIGPVKIGVAVYDPKAEKTWYYAGYQPFPFMSTFKTLACAKLLQDVEQGKISSETEVVITKEMIKSWSPITEKKINQSITFHQACHATMTMSDNTAANIVLDAIGGPEALTAFLRDIGDDVSRLDRMETDLNEARPGDLRDTTTPMAMVQNLNTLIYGDVLSVESRAQLKKWMMENKVSDRLIRSVLPEGWSIADRSGAGGYGSRAITASVWSEEQGPLLIAIYMTQTELAFADRNKAIAQIGHEILKHYQNGTLFK